MPRLDLKQKKLSFKRERKNEIRNKKGTIRSDITEIFITIHVSQISGTAKDAQNRVYEISGYVDSSGQIIGSLAIGGNTVVGITDYLSDKTGDCFYKTVNGCAGAWSASMQSFSTNKHKID